MAVKQAKENHNIYKYSLERHERLWFFCLEENTQTDSLKCVTKSC